MCAVVLNQTGYMCVALKYINLHYCDPENRMRPILTTSKNMFLLMFCLKFNIFTLISSANIEILMILNASYAQYDYYLFYRWQLKCIVSAPTLKV